MKVTKSFSGRQRDKALQPPVVKPLIGRRTRNKFVVQPSTLKPQHLTIKQIERAVEHAVAARIA